MADGLQKGKVGEDLTASAPMEPQKTIQVWGQTQEYVTPTVVVLYRL